MIVETFLNRGGIELLRSMLAHPSALGEQDEDQPAIPNDQSLPWCKCGRCRPMPTP